MQLANHKHEAFAQHVASGLSLTQSAIRAGYAESGAANIGSRLAKNHQNINQRIDELRRSHGTGMQLEHGMRSSLSRVAAKEDRWLRLRCVINERAKDPDMAEVPGGRTGLLLKQIRVTGSGEKQSVSTTFVLDSAILSELRALEEEVATELGQRIATKQSFLREEKTYDVRVTQASDIKSALAEQMSALPAADRQALADAVDIKGPEQSE